MILKRVIIILICFLLLACGDDGSQNNGSSSTVEESPDSLEILNLNDPINYSGVADAYGNSKIYTYYSTETNYEIPVTWEHEGFEIFGVCDEYDETNLTFRFEMLNSSGEQIRELSFGVYAIALNELELVVESEELVIPAGGSLVIEMNFSGKTGCQYQGAFKLSEM
jgi:hypothetical protein